VELPRFVPVAAAADVLAVALAVPVVVCVVAIPSAGAVPVAAPKECKPPLAASPGFSAAAAGSSFLAAKLPKRFGLLADPLLALANRLAGAPASADFGTAGSLALPNRLAVGPSPLLGFPKRLGLSVDGAAVD